MFRIILHIDDKAVLMLIQKNLKIGKVSVDLKAYKAIFEVSAQSEIALIIAIFHKFNLNTTKHLNFVDFSKAFRLYVEITKSTSNTEVSFRKDVEAEILSIKDSSFSFLKTRFEGQKQVLSPQN